MRVCACVRVCVCVGGGGVSLWVRSLDTDVSHFSFLYFRHFNWTESETDLTIVDSSFSTSEEKASITMEKTDPSEAAYSMSCLLIN